jgi:peptidoglycan/LPS O-acetylase OafA/YrhL
MGVIRLFLACGVFLLHLDEQVLDRAGLRVNPIWIANLIGGRAVIFFYIVSGFLISYVLNSKYPATAAGARAFYRSRFLRIYPLWWVVLLLCLAIGAGRWTRGPTSDLAPAVLVGSDWLVAFRRYPLPDWGVFPPGAEVGWTLGAELAFYLLAPWILRSTSRVLVLFACSAAVRASLLWLIAPADPSFKTWTYLFFPSILVFFLLGHLAERVHRWRPIGAALSAALMVAAAVAACGLDGSTSVDDPRFHVAALCFAAGLPGVFAVTKDHRVSSFLGDLTYPLYLTHSLVIVALFSSALAGFGRWLIVVGGSLGSAELAGAFTAVACLVIALCVAAATHAAVESPLRAAFAWLIDRAAPRLLVLARRVVPKPRLAGVVPPAGGE